MADEELTFDALDLRFGHQLLIHPNPADKTQVFNASLVGCLADESLIISPPANGIFSEVREGQKIAIRVFLDSGVALFMSTVLYISEIPAVMIYIDFPRDIKFKRLRSARRVYVALPIIATNLDNPAYASVAGRLVDVSTGGGQLEMAGPLGAENDRIEIKGKFPIQGIVRLLTVSACIRQCNKNSYGVQFVEQDEEKLIVLMGFIFNAMLTGTVNSIR